MRQLFLLACVCLVTWSGTAGVDPQSPIKSSLPELTVALSETTGRAVDEPAQHKPAAGNIALEMPELTAEQLADLLANLAIEFPVPSGEAERIPLPPISKPVVARSREEVCSALTEAAQTNDLPLAFFIHLLFQESRFNPAVVSPAGAEGIAQFMPETSADMGLANPYDPLQAIHASARLLRGLVAQFGNLGLAAAAYNAGPKRIQEWLDKKGKLPEETQGYVKTITGRQAENWTAATARHPVQRLPRHAPCQEAAGLLAWNGPEPVPVPSPSPQRATALASKRSVTAVSRPDVKVTHDGGRMTATVAIAGNGNVGRAAQSIANSAPTARAKPAAAVEQFTARKTRSKKVAQR